MMPEPGVKLLLIATRPYSAMFDGNFVITTLRNRPENTTYCHCAKSVRVRIYPSSYSVQILQIQTLLRDAFFVFIWSVIVATG